MSEARQLSIDGPAGRIETAVRLAAAARAAAVVTHPHPLQGGDMRNPVVFHSERALSRAGLTTVRINFRGVGRSAGEYDAGKGEVDDVAAVIAWTRDLAPRLPLLLVGYSFGAWCAIRYAVTDSGLAGVIAIGLPLTARFPLPELERLHCPLTVVQADADEFGPPDELRSQLNRFAPDATVRLVQGTTHFFPDRARDVAREVVAAADESLPAG